MDKILNVEKQVAAPDAQPLKDEQKQLLAQKARLNEEINELQDLVSLYIKSNPNYNKKVEPQAPQVQTVVETREKLVIDRDATLAAVHLALRYAHYKHGANHKPIEGLCEHWAVVSDSNRPYADNKHTYTALAENLLKASTGEDWAAARELINTEARAEPVVPAKKEEVKPVAAVVEETKEAVAEPAPEQEAAERKQETAA